MVTISSSILRNSLPNGCFELLHQTTNSWILLFQNLFTSYTRPPSPMICASLSLWVSSLLSVHRFTRTTHVCAGTCSVQAEGEVNLPLSLLCCFLPIFDKFSLHQQQALKYENFLRQKTFRIFIDYARSLFCWVVTNNTKKITQGATILRVAILWVKYNETIGRFWIC